MQFQAAGAAFDLFDQRRGGCAISLPEEAEIHGPRFGGLQHARDIPRAGSAGGGGRAGGRAGAAANHGGDAVRERFANLLRRDEVDVAIHAAGGKDQIFSGDHFGGGANDQIGINPRHRVWISGFADFHDAAVFDADVGFHDAPVIEDYSVGNDEVQRAVFAFSGGARALAHAVANYFAAAESDLVAVVRVIFFDFDY